MFTYAAKRPSTGSQTAQAATMQTRARGRGPLVQAKLFLGSAQDPLEREADRVAARVAAGSNPGAEGLTRGSHATVQRACAACEQEEEDGPVQRKQASAAAPLGVLAGAPLGSRFSADVQGAISRGRPLAPSLLESMQSGFQLDFSRVRIHADSHAAALARQIDARAFTVGRDIFFNRGQFAPEHRAGKELLAHELTHVVQQGHASETVGGDVVVRRSPPDRSGARVAEKIAFQLLQASAGVSDVVMLMQIAGAALRELPPEQKRELAVLYFRFAPPAILQMLATHKQGHVIIQHMASFVEESDMDADLRQTLGEYGRLSVEKTQRINDLPAAGDCVTNLQKNVGIICGEEARSEMQDRENVSASQRAYEEMDPAERPADPSQVVGKPLTSGNLNHLTDLGGAVPLGHFYVTRDECREKVRFDETLFRSNKSAEKKNPFKLRKGTDWNVLKWTPVHPEKAMLDAVRHGNPGLYAFGLSLNQFHTVTIVLKKDAEGPLRPGGGGYELFWNDQNVKKVGALGETIPANDLARRLFNTFNDPDFTDPRVFKTPATMEGHTDPLPLGEWAKRWENDNLYVGDQDKARRNFLGIRCQTQGVMIWQLFPK